MTPDARARLATMAVFFINGAAFATWAANIPSVRERLHLSESALGFVLFGLAVGSVAALALAGRLIARFGSRDVTAVSTLLLIVLIPALVASPSVGLLVAGLVVVGVAISLMDVAMNAHGVLVEGRLERPIMSSLHALFSAGALAGAGGGALLLGAGLASTTHALLASALLAALAALALPRLLPSRLDRGAHEDGPVFVLPRGALLGVSLLVMLAYVGEGAIADWSAVYLRDGLKASYGLAAGGYAAFNLAMVAARLAGDTIRARFSSAVLLRGSGVLAALGVGLALAAPLPAVAFTGFALAGLGFANVVPVLFSSAGSIPGVPAATALAAAASAGYFGFLAGPPSIGALASAFSLRAALGLVVLFGVLIAFFAGSARRGTETDAAQERPT